MARDNEATRSVLKGLFQELSTEGLIHPTDAVVVGISGGADSMALLHLLVSLREHHPWPLNIHIAHFNHKLRGAESEKDAAFVQGAADSLDLPCTIGSTDIAALSAREGLGVEELARRERYAFFERVCVATGFSIVAVAHHADDQAETILHRVLRGTVLLGLSCIPKSRPLRIGGAVRLVRPLLGFTRKQLLDYLSDEGIAWREDRSNQSNEPMRNLMRNEILPKLEAEVNPQVREALIRLGEQARWLKEFLGETVEKTFETLVLTRTDQCVALNVEALARKSRIVQTELIRLAYRSLGVGEQELTFAHVVAIGDLVNDSAGGKQVQLPSGMMVEKRYGRLQFSLATPQPRETISPDVAVHLPGVTSLPIRGLELTCVVMEIQSDDVPRLRRGANKLEEHVDYEAVHPPLVVRSKKPGDRFFPLGAPGSKKVSDFLADAKVAPEERDRVAVLCDQLGPIWIVGHRIDDRVKLTALTRRVLRLQARQLTS
ncbi:MAG: tRNA lysidine(34) synthetase TilS [Planctomycetota bacterium]